MQTTSLVVAVLMMTLSLAGLVVFKLCSSSWRNLALIVGMLALLTGATVTLIHPSAAQPPKATAPP